MIEKENTVSSDLIYTGKTVSLRVDTVEVPNKGYQKREIVEHQGAIAIVALTDDDKVVLIKQFRKPIEQVIWEIPAGKLEIGENPKDCAIRELKEETGAVDFNKKPVCVYSVKGKTRVNNNATKESFGMLYAAEIFSFEEIHSEIEKIVLSDDLIRQWTYPLIQPKLISEAKKRGYL